MPPITCPKCAYVRQPKDDSSPDWSCPSCGIVYAKYDPEKDRVNQAKLDAIRAKAIERQQAAEHAEHIQAASHGNWAALPNEMVPAKIQNIMKALRDRAADPSRIPVQFQKSFMFVVTTPTVPGREIDMALDIVSSECAYGMNILKDFFAEITDVVGGRSGSTQTVLADARKKVLDEMRAQAYALGADAIVGVHFDFNEFSGGAKSMLFVVGTGTAVKLKAVPQT